MDTERKLQILTKQLEQEIDILKNDERVLRKYKKTPTANAISIHRETLEDLLRIATQ